LTFLFNGAFHDSLRGFVIFRIFVFAQLHHVLDPLFCLSRQHTRRLLIEMRIFQAIHLNLVGLENLANFLDLFDSYLDVVGLLKDEGFQLHVSKLLVEVFEELERVLDDLVG